MTLPIMKTYGLVLGNGLSRSSLRLLLGDSGAWSGLAYVIASAERVLFGLTRCGGNAGNRLRRASRQGRELSNGLSRSRHGLLLSDSSA